MQTSISRLPKTNRVGSVQALKANAARNRALRISVAHYMSTSLQRAFIEWQYFTWQRVTLRECAAIGLQRLRLRIWSRGLHAWASWAERKRSSAEKRVRADTHWRRGTLSAWLLEWHMHAVTEPAAVAFWCGSIVTGILSSE